MNINESAKILALLAANYPHYYKKLSKNETNAVCKTWNDSFDDVPAVLVLEALKNCIGKLKFPPTIADVNEELRHMYSFFLCESNNMTLTQAERSEAERMRQLLYDLGFGIGTDRTMRRARNLLRLGGISALSLEA